MTGSRGVSGGVGSFLKRAVREPLLQFLAAAIVLFGANALIHGPDRGPPTNTITISEGRVQQIAESYRLLSGRMPSKIELQSLVDDYVSEEVDYREAVAMGLDADDTIVRRRMRQKLEFLVEDAAASDEPSEAELDGWLKAHAEQYRLPARLAIRQVLANGDKRGAEAGPEAARMLAALKAGKDPSGLGDPSMLPGAMPLTTEQGVAALFGADFAKTVFAHEGSGWFGPVASAFGQHVVMIMEREPGSEASLDDVRDKVRNDWIEAKRDKVRDEAQAKLRQRYDVKIEWPKGYEDLPSTPNPAPKTPRTTDVGGE